MNFRTRRDIGTRLRMHREAAHITQEDLAKSAGVGRTQITNIEAGRSSITTEVLIGCCRYLNVSADAILGLETTTDAERRILQLHAENTLLRTAVQSASRILAMANEDVPQR